MLKWSPSNLPSVCQHATIVEEHVAKERATGRLLGPLPPQLARLCHTSPIGLIPKPHQPGRWRLIVDISSPHDGSVNDAISVDHCHMHNASVLHAAAMIRQLRPGSMLAKIDLHHKYRILPVHADDHALLGINWGVSFIMAQLPVSHQTGAAVSDQPPQPCSDSCPARSDISLAHD